MKIENDVNSPIKIPIQVGGTDIFMELDTGAAVSVMNINDFHKLNLFKQLRPSSKILRSYGGQVIPCEGGIS